MDFGVEQVINVQEDVIERLMPVACCQCCFPLTYNNEKSLGGRLRFDYLPVDSQKALGATEPCLSIGLEHVLEGLRLVPAIGHPDFNRSNSIRTVLSQHLSSKIGWIPDFLALESIPRNFPNKNYVIDHIFDGDCRSCDVRHRLQIEVCFDNRQAIGTNILKLEIGAEAFRRRTGGRAFSLIICGNRKALKFGGWDSGVADDNEYQIAIDTAYKSILSGNVALVVMQDG